MPRRADAGGDAAAGIEELVEAVVLARIAAPTTRRVVSIPAYYERARAARPARSSPPILPIYARRTSRGFTG